MNKYVVYIENMAPFEVSANDYREAYQTARDAYTGHLSNPQIDVFLAVLAAH